MRALTLSLRVLLLLALILVSGHQAVGRAMAKGAVSLELCSDGGLVTVTLDAQGNPVEHSHACPDCVLAGLAVEAGMPSLHPPVPVCRMLTVDQGAGTAGPMDVPAPAARGPPARALA
jgi:hypothetical protein